MKVWTVWITGLPGSGKSTVTKSLRQRLERNGVPSQILGVDMLRQAMTPQPTYSEEERRSVYATLVFIAKLLNQNGINVIIDATANLREYRDRGRQELRNLIIAYTKCPIETSMQRESERRDSQGAPRGIYQKGLEGKSTTVPGINVPYEEPTDADVIVETDKITPTEAAEKIANTITAHFGE
jgi:adenylylsulfate kinase